ncbi:MAG: hypothetical protein CMK07_09895 [Ponticaulis sp.]|nr:hypothetical protein [Ponticaulis sp.]
MVKVNLFAALSGFILGWTIGNLFLGVAFAALLVLAVQIWHMFATRFVLNHLNAVSLTQASSCNPIHRMFLGDAYKLAEQANMGRTQFSIIETDLPLAFSLGSRQSGGRIVVTSGLFKTLTRLEIASVIAHELGHIRAGERAATGLLLSFSALLAKTGLFGWVHRANKGVSGLGNVLPFRRAGLTPECRADAFAAALCKNTGILASALKKLERGIRASHWDGLETLPALGRVAIVDPRHAYISSASPEISPMAHRVAELHRLQLAEAA